MIDKLRQKFSIPFLCSIFRVSKSGYYKWRNIGISERVKKDEQLKLHIVSFNKRTHNVYSDRGSQYCSYAYRHLLKSHNVIQSMSGKGNCYDNAPMESFWGTLKTELINGKKYKTRAEAISDIVRYIEIFYNRERIQSKPGYLSPIKYLIKYYE